jgi:hypothetical protein
MFFIRSRSIDAHSLRKRQETVFLAFKGSMAGFPLDENQRSIREWALPQGWGGRPVRVEQAPGILVAALGVLARYYGYSGR